MNKIVINIIIIVLLLPFIPFIENVQAESNSDFVVVNYEAREQDINNDGFIDQLRIVFNVNTTKTQIPISAQVTATFDQYPIQYEIGQWDNFTLTNEKSLSRSVFVDAWKEGEYTVTLRFINPMTNEVISEYQLGVFNLMVGIEKPFLALNVIANHEGRAVDDNFNTGSECKVKRNILDKIGHRYNQTGEVQFIGAPWITPPIEPGELVPNTDEVDCSNWPAGKYSLKMI